VLGLRPLDPPDQPIGPRERGTAVHDALERFATDHGGELPEDVEDLIRLYLIEALDAARLPQGRMAREEALARNVAPWLAAFERARRPGARLVLEQRGELLLTLGDHTFTVSAKADRIEVREGSADVLDFKTGRAPSQKQVDTHLAPQLTLTAAILQGGGFADAKGVEPGELVYVQVSGGRKVGDIAVRGGPGESLMLAADALARLERRAGAFFNADVPYISRAIPQFVGESGDYDHLARLWEWSTVGGEEGGE
jgi:ATP-dependent helicase/nuclease subunit B